MERQQRRQFGILHALREAGRPLTSAEIAEALDAAGMAICERTVRLYLKGMDRDGLTQAKGRSGRIITAEGIAALKSANMLQRVGLMSARIDQITCRTSFDLEALAGKVVVNLSLLPPAQLQACAEEIGQVFAQGFAVGDRLTLLPPGARLGDAQIPPDRVGFCTVCSITFNSILLRHGIPARSRFAGLLQLRNRKPLRFVELIEYDGTSIDPLEVFIRSGMTDYRGAIANGNGRIGASFREFPAESREEVARLAKAMENAGLNVLVQLGYPGHPVLDIPVSEGRVGAVLVGGLNPVAILEERGWRNESHAMAGHLPYSALWHYSELPRRLGSI